MVKQSSSKVCKDCVAAGITSKRPAPYPGPRCFSHHHTVKLDRSKTSHGKMVERTYGITEDEYWLMYESQGGKCAICQWASGKTKRLAVDHDHYTGKVRGLLCGKCNQYLGYLRNAPEAYIRGAIYLEAAIQRGVTMRTSLAGGSANSQI